MIKSEAEKSKPEVKAKVKAKAKTEAKKKIGILKRFLATIIGIGILLSRVASVMAYSIGIIVVAFWAYQLFFPAPDPWYIRSLHIFYTPDPWYVKTWHTILSF